MAAIAAPNETPVFHNLDSSTGSSEYCHNLDRNVMVNANILVVAEVLP